MQTVREGTGWADWCQYSGTGPATEHCNHCPWTPILPWQRRSGRQAHSTFQLKWKLNKQKKQWMLKLEWKKRSEETQTLRAGCSKAGARDGRNLISWRWSLPLPANPVWWGSMHAISNYHSNRPTHIQTYTHRQDRLQYTAPQLASAQCNYAAGTITHKNCS